MSGFNLNDNDVVKLDSSENPAQTTTSTHGEVMQAIWASVRYRLGDSGSLNRIFSQGVRGQVLRPGSSWLSGTVRVRLEFIPEEDEEEPQEVVLLPPAKEKSPLDDLRAELLNNE